MSCSILRWHKILSYVFYVKCWRDRSYLCVFIWIPTRHVLWLSYGCVTGWSLVLLVNKVSHFFSCRGTRLHDKSLGFCFLQSIHPSTALVGNEQVEGSTCSSLWDCSRYWGRNRERQKRSQSPTAPRGMLCPLHNAKWRCQLARGSSRPPETGPACRIDTGKSVHPEADADRSGFWDHGYCHALVPVHQSTVLMGCPEPLSSSWETLETSCSVWGMALFRATHEESGPLDLRAPDSKSKAKCKGKNTITKDSKKSTPSRGTCRKITSQGRWVDTGLGAAHHPRPSQQHPDFL